MDVSGPEVTVLCDELVLDGVEPDDALVGEALQRALAPRLAEHGLQSTSQRVTESVRQTVAREAR